MRTLVKYRVSMALVLFLAVWASRAYAATHEYREDFTTTQHKDTLSTTADWNTAAGLLQLYPLPRLAGSYDTPGLAYGVTVSGDYAFVADAGSGLQVIDITDPASPTFAGSYNTPSLAYGVAVSGDHAFVAARYSGLQVIDISNPASPTLAGSYDTTDDAQEVAVSGDHAFVADGLSGLQVIDITDPTNPTLAGSYDTPGTAYSVAVSGDHAFVADGSSGLQVIDITNPASPTLAGSYDTPGVALGVAVSGDHAYVADFTSGLQVLDISDPTNPTPAGTYNTQGSAYSVVISGDRAFVADFTAGLQVIDITDPTSPTLAESYNTPGSARGVAASGGHAFVADHTSGLQVIQISSPAPPALAGNYTTPGTGQFVAVSGDHAYLADLGSGLQVIDITDPTNPTLAGTYNTPGNAVGVAVSGDHAYVGDLGSGLQVIDILDPTNPTLVGTYNTPGNASGVVVDGNHAFVADGPYGLRVIDISNPANPTQAGVYNTPGLAYDVAVSGNHAYVGDVAGGLQIIDISDPTNPTLAGTYNTPDRAYSVALSGDHAYVGDITAGLQVIDISDPTNPTLTGTYDTPGNPYAVAVSGDHVFLADGPDGLQVIDVSDPANPRPVGTYGTPGTTYGIAVSGDHAFLSDVTGLHVIHVFQGEVDTGDNVGQSIAVDDSDYSIINARMTATQTDSIRWELSADGGANWQDVAPDGAWNLLAVNGTDLLWRSTHTWVAPGTNPAVSNLHIEWLYDHAVIDAVTDIPNDQGRQVSVEWTRSSHDFIGDPMQIVEYAVYRKIDPNLSAMAAPASSETFAHLSAPARHSALMMQAAGWHFLVTVPVRTEDTYAVVVPTLKDSTIAAGGYLSTFMVASLTATPGVFFDSPPDSGYSVDNLEPAVPAALAVAYNTGSGNMLSWDDPTDPDFQYFRVYRSNDPNFVPSPAELVHATTAIGWTDPDYDGWNVYYKTTAVDYSGNESDPAAAGTATGVDNGAQPVAFHLYQNVPNPFNPSTTIQYDVPAGRGAVTLRIYDVSGRLVRTLVDGHQTPGVKRVTWDARNDQGHRVTSGVYFYRMTAPGHETTRKMILLQ